MIYRYGKINDELYKEHFHVFVGDRKRMAAKIKKLMAGDDFPTKQINDLADDIGDASDNAGEFIWLTNNKTNQVLRILWFRELEWYTHNYATVAHECMHATFKLMDSRGVKFDTFNDEPFTYHHTWLMSRVLDMMMKWDHVRIGKLHGKRKK